MKLWMKLAGVVSVGVLSALVSAAPAWALHTSRPGRILGTTFSRILDVPLYQNGVVVQGGPLFANGMGLSGNVIDFAGGGFETGNIPQINFSQGGSRIFDDKDLRIVTDDDLYLGAPGAVFVQNNLNVGGGLAVASLATTGTTTLTTLNVSGNASVAGTLSAGALSVGTGTVTITDTGVTTPNLTVTSNSTFPAGDIVTADLADNAVTDAKVVDTITASNYLLLSGGTVTGATTFSASGTALTVTNNSSIGGTLSVSGAATLSGGTILPAGDIGNADLATDSVTAIKIAANAVDASEIASGAVSSDEIANGGVANADLANSSLTVTAGTGLTGGGAVALGGATTIDLGTLTGLSAGADALSILYGSAANTAVQGNTALTVTAGSGLTGGGTITLGSGGSTTLSIGADAITDAMLQNNITVASTTGVNAAVTRNVAGSFQPVWGDLTVGDSFGTAAAADSDFGAGMMGNILGTNNLVNANNYLAGVIGAYSLTGSVPSDYPKGGVLGLVGPGVVTNTADGAVVAVLDGDNGQVNATAAFKVMGLNSTAASGFSYGLDLFSAAHDGYLATNEMIDVADIRLQNGETISNEVDGLIDFGAANLATTGQFTTLIQAAAGVEAVVSDNTAGSFQSIAGDFTPGALFGTSGALDTDFGAGVMGNILGPAAMTNTHNYLAGVIGHYSLTGTNLSTYPKGAVLAGIGDGSTTANGAVVAYIDGDSGAATNAVAAFKVMNNNSTAGNRFGFGLDLFSPARDGYLPVSFGNADIRLSSGVVITSSAGAPTSSGAAANTCNLGAGTTNFPRGSLYLRTDGDAITTLYVCTATDIWTAK